jgi:hypothetical protein
VTTPGGGVFAEAELKKWWDRLTDEQRVRVKAAAGEHHLDAAGTKLLLDTRCPVGPIGTKWESQPEYSWIWPESVREFVAGHEWAR